MQKYIIEQFPEDSDYAVTFFNFLYNKCTNFLYRWIQIIFNK